MLHHWDVHHGKITRLPGRSAPTEKRDTKVQLAPTTIIQNWGNSTAKSSGPQLPRAQDPQTIHSRGTSSQHTLLDMIALLKRGLGDPEVDTPNNWKVWEEKNVRYKCCLNVLTPLKRIMTMGAKRPMNFVIQRPRLLQNCRQIVAITMTCSHSKKHLS